MAEEYLLPEWRALLSYLPLPEEDARSAVEVRYQARWWRRSGGQLAHALRTMRNRGLVESPERGKFRLTEAGLRAVGRARTFGRYEDGGGRAC